MRRTLLGFLAAMSCAGGAPAPAELQLPAFPLPLFVEEAGQPKEINSTRLQRELMRGGAFYGYKYHFETVDTDYGLMRGDNVGRFAAWLEVTCEKLGFDLRQMRTRAYDGGTFSRLLAVSASLAVLQAKKPRLVAVPIGLMICKRDTAWGELKRDGVMDAYIIFATEDGILVYDPPTRQLVNLSDFPNKAGITQIRF